MADPETTEHIWRLLHERLRGFILKRVGDEHVAADLLQEAFLRIHRDGGSLRDQERLTSWVFQIVRNLIADHYRSRQSSSALLNGRVSENVQAGEVIDHLPSDAGDHPTDDPNGGDPNYNGEVAQWITQAINSLPATYRAAVHMFEVERIAQQGIADRLGLSLSGAKARVQRGRAMLRQILDDCCRFEFDRRGNVIDYQRKTSRSNSQPMNGETPRPCAGCDTA